MSRTRIASALAGAAFVGVVTALVRTGGAAVGVFSRPSLLIVAGGVGAGGLAGLMASRPLEPWPFRIGAAAAGVAALVYRSLEGEGGAGALTFTAAIAAVIVVFIGPSLARSVGKSVPGWLAVAGLLLVALVLVRIVVGSGELGHDEAAYALKARSWLRGTPDTGWGLHRGVGQSVLALIVLPLRESATALRLVSVALSTGTVVAVWALGRTMRSDRVGVAAAALFAVAPSFLRRGAEFLSDVPSTGLLLVVTMLLWKWATSESVRNQYLYTAVIVASVAFYVRYQSVLAMALLVVATIAVARRRVIEQGKAVAGAAGLGILLLLPHFILAIAQTGSPWGIITFTAAAGRRAYLGEGLVDYLRDLPDLLAGQLGAIALALAVAWFMWRWFGHADRRPALFLAIPSLGQFLALGLLSHGEPRFVFFPVALMMVAAAIAVDDLHERTPDWAYRAGVLTFVVALVGSLGLHGSRMDAGAEARGGTIAVLEEAAAVIAAEASHPCGVITGMQPQLTWLTECDSAPFNLAHAEIRLGPEFDRFMILSEKGPREPEGALEEAYLALAGSEPIRIDGAGSIGDVEVWPVQNR